MPSSRAMRFGRYDYATFLTFFAYASGSVAVPVALVTISRDLGFPLAEGGMTEGGVLHLGRTIPMVVAMLVCGFAAGWWGTRKTLAVSVLLMAAGVLLASLAPAYGVLLFALILAGCGEGVIEGLATPFVQDLHPSEPGRYTNFTHAFWSVGVFATVIAAGAMLAAGVSWRLVLTGVSLLGMLAGGLLLTGNGKGTSKSTSSQPLPWRTIAGHGRAILAQPLFWRYYLAMFLAGGGEFCLTFWSASHIQIHFQSTPWAGGAGTACFAGGMILGRTGWGYLLDQHHLRRLIMISAVLGAGLGLTMPLVESLVIFFILLFLLGVATAPFWPSIQSHAVERMKTSDATMLLILLSCAGIPGCGAFTYLMGFLGDRNGSLANAFYLVPACYGAIALLLLAERKSSMTEAIEGREKVTGSDRIQNSSQGDPGSEAWSPCPHTMDDLPREIRKPGTAGD